MSNKGDGTNNDGNNIVLNNYNNVGSGSGIGSGSGSDSDSGNGSGGCEWKGSSSSFVRSGGNVDGGNGEIFNNNNNKTINNNNNKMSESNDS